jgi:alpha/beta superfamily hydrolase
MEAFMQGERIWLEVKDGPRLEAEYYPAKGAPRGGLIALHPHPMYGGSMHNNVVEAMLDAAARAGFCGLRFNFRGVGDSGGRHEGGKGETADVITALNWLQTQTQGPLVLGGYSFGALVGSYSVHLYPNLAGAVWVSPPLSIGPMADWPYDAGPMLVLCGDQDEFAPSEQIRKYVGQQGARSKLNLVYKANHFWWDQESVLIQETMNFLLDLNQAG